MEGNADVDPENDGAAEAEGSVNEDYENDDEKVADERPAPHPLRQPVPHRPVRHLPEPNWPPLLPAKRPVLRQPLSASQQAPSAQQESSPLRAASALAAVRHVVRSRRSPYPRGKAGARIRGRRRGSRRRRRGSTCLCSAVRW